MKLQYLVPIISSLAVLSGCHTAAKLIPCGNEAFQSLSQAAKLHDWGDDNYIKALKEEAGSEARAKFCTKAISYQGAAYCKASYDPFYKKQLIEMVELCQDEAQKLGIAVKQLLNDSSSDAIDDAASDIVNDAASDTISAQSDKKSVVNVANQAVDGNSDRSDISVVTAGATFNFDDGASDNGH